MIKVMVEDKPPQHEAIKFEGGLESATEVIKWIEEQSGLTAFYSPDRGGVQGEFIIIPHKDDGAAHVHRGAWIVKDRTDRIGGFGPFVFCETDEQLRDTYNMVL